MGTLESRERRVVRLRFGFDGEPLTQAQIAKVTGMSQPTVYRVLEQAMETLRAELRAEEIVGM
jgi:RNA polymerase sigma factor (sigma-70 family)